jgi:hypothetical protein
MARKVDHLSRVTAAAEALRVAHIARDKALVAAVESGDHSMRAVARAAGLSAEGVRKIVDKLTYSG